MEPKILPITLWDDPVLSRVCTPVDDAVFGTGALADFAEQLLATMKEANGLGLAAPQVNVTMRMFVFRSPGKETAPPIVVCNPTLTLSGPEVRDREGCLSLPGLYEQVSRADHVNMHYRQPDGKRVELILDGWDARVAQHEFDHLNGVMFFNYADKRPRYGARMSKQVSKQLMRKWEKEKGRRGL